MKSINNKNILHHFHQLSKSYPLIKAKLGNNHEWQWIDTKEGAKTLLMLPGFLGTAETSFLFIISLAINMRVISVSIPPTINNTKEFCYSFAILLNQLKINNLTILGGSSGGFLAQSFIRVHPEMVANLILTHTGLPNKKWHKTTRYILHAIDKIPFTIIRNIMHLSVYYYFPAMNHSHIFWRSHFQNIIKRLSHQAVKNRFNLLNDFHAHNLFVSGDLDKWKGKTLIMEMHKDQLTNSKEQIALQMLYPQAILHSFSNTAHFDSVENPQEQIEVIRNFMLTI